MQDPSDYHGCLFDLQDIFGGHTHRLLSKQLGPIVTDWLFGNSRCVWCNALLLLPHVSEKAIVCCNGHPTCDRCWVNQQDPKRRNNKGRRHTKCLTCDRMYCKYPMEWKRQGLPSLREAMEKIPVPQCMNLKRDDTTTDEKSDQCATWNALSTQQRTLWQWITAHALYDCDCDRVKCSKCYRVMPRSQARSHFVTDCRHRQVTCPDCNGSCEAWELTSDNWNSHRSVCPAKREPCIFRGNGCVEMVRQSDRQSHRGTCPFRWEGQYSGCGINVMVGKMTEHIEGCPRCQKTRCPVATKWPQHSEKLDPECRSCPLYRLAEHMCDPKIRPIHEKIMLMPE